MEKIMFNVAYTSDNEVSKELISKTDSFFNYEEGKEIPEGEYISNMEIKILSEKSVEVFINEKKLGKVFFMKTKTVYEKDGIKTVIGAEDFVALVNGRKMKYQLIGGPRPLQFVGIFTNEKCENSKTILISDIEARIEEVSNGDNPWTKEEILKRKKLLDGFNKIKPVHYMKWLDLIEREGNPFNCASKPKRAFREVDKGLSIMADLSAYISAGENLILAGDKGTGKNSALEWQAWLFGLKLVVFPMNGNTTSMSLLGSKTTKASDCLPKELRVLAEKAESSMSLAQEAKLMNEKDLALHYYGEAKKASVKILNICREDEALQRAYAEFLGNKKAGVEIVFEPSCIINAMMDRTQGSIVVFDEFNTANASVVPLINGWLDGHSEGTYVEGLGFVERNEKVHFFATMNDGGYAGTHAQNEATKDRLGRIDFPQPGGITEIVNAGETDLKSSELDEMDFIYKSIKEMVADGKIKSRDVSIRGFIRAAKLESYGLELGRGLQQNVAAHISANNEKEALKEVISSKMAT